MCRTFRAFCWIAVLPRALPWADLFNPFGAPDKQFRERTGIFSTLDAPLVTGSCLFPDINQDIRLGFVQSESTFLRYSRSWIMCSICLRISCCNWLSVKGRDPA